MKIKKRTFFRLLFLGSLVCASLLVKDCHAQGDIFVADLSDRPTNNPLGIFCLQAGVCGAASLGGAALFRAGGRPDMEWLPGAMITAAGILIHTGYVIEGGKNRDQAILEQVFESAGCFTVLLF